MNKVCHLQVLPLMSGVQRAMLGTLKHLDRSRYEIHVVCQGPGPLTCELDRLDIAWHAVPDLIRPIRPQRDWRAYCHLYRLFQEQRFDIVHTHSSKPGILGRVAARRAGVPHVIHHVHAFAFHEFSPPIQRRFYSRLEKWAGGFCDRVLFVNREELELSTRSGWLPEEKCETIYNGVDLHALDPARAHGPRQAHRENWQIEPDEAAIVFVGRLAYPKQPMMIPVIAQALQQRLPHGRWRILVAGDGPEEAAVRSAVAERRLEGRVQFLGWQDDPIGVLHAADIVFLTSLAEGLPCALIEAQAAGKPVVAGNAKGVREVVTAGSGFLCPPRDADCFAAKLAQLVEDAALRSRLGRAARRHAEENFDAEVNLCRVAAIYDELVGHVVSEPALLRAA